MDGSTLKPGWWVALTLHRDTAPLRSYVGQIQEIGERGLRIKMLDWADGSASDYELFVPWPSIASAMVATDSRDPAEFEKRAGQWSSHSAGLGGEFDPERAHANRGVERTRTRATPAYGG